MSAAPAPAPSSSVPDLGSRAALVRDLAVASGAVIRRWFRQGATVMDKSDDSPVTRADQDSEAIIRHLITRRFPEDGIIGEEHGVEGREAEFVWVIDPIDGTGAFIAGLPVFTTLIGLAWRGRLVLGAVHQPVTGEFWIGGVGVPATLNDQLVLARLCPRLSDAVLFSTDPALLSAADSPGFEALCAAIRRRRLGTDGYGGAMVASGHADLWCEAGMKVYDYAALVPLIEAAGGRISDWQGKPLGLDGDGTVLASGDPALHGAALALLRPEASPE
ncbi:MAG: inositol monophosphatase family protein [Rhodospirillaceae bacterium]